MDTDQRKNSRPNAYFWQPMQNPREKSAVLPIEIVSGDGVHVVDDRGRRLLDATSGGLSNVTLGYSATPIKRAMQAQLDKLPYFTAFRGNTNAAADELARMLVEDWFGADGMARVFFSSGGSDSVDTAMRLSRQYWKISGARDRYKFIALRNGYHGTHFGGASINSRPAIRRNYEPLLSGCFHIPTPCTFRNPFDETDPERLCQLVTRLLEEEIVFQGPNTVAAFIAEPITGAGGLVVPPERFWPEARRICDKYGVLLIADEVITGFGRTGEDCGARLWGTKPDLMILAKGITSGYFPLGATLVGERLAAAFEAEESTLGLIAHGYTYSGHPVGCAAAMAALKLSRELGTTGLARQNGALMMEGLRQTGEKYARVGDVRGRGLMACMEIVTDPDTKTQPNPEFMMAIGDAVMEEGVLIRVNGTQLLITPPLVVDSAQIEKIVSGIDRALARTVK